MKETICVRELSAPGEKTALSRLILEALPDWFGIPEAREKYIENSEFEVFPTLWDEWNPCQIYVVYVGG